MFTGTLLTGPRALALGLLVPLLLAFGNLVSTGGGSGGGAAWAADRESRLSGAVAFVTTGGAMEQFLRAPGPAYYQAYVRFGPDMPDDVIMAIDQEFFEGVDDPIRVKGGDWMAFVGVQRPGVLWVPAGTDANMAGTATETRDWKIQMLGAPLQPDAWYRLRVEADFGTRRFRSFTIEGPGLNKTVDLSEYRLDYPNYAPFDGRAMTYYVVAMRGRGMMKRKGTPVAYFDDVQAGVMGPGGNWVTVFTNSFETQTSVGRQPTTLPVIKLDGYTQGRWYLERDESLIRIESVPFARSGSRVAVADANLD